MRCDFGFEGGFQAGRLRLPGTVPFTGSYAFWRWRIASLLMQMILCNPASAGDSGVRDASPSRFERVMINEPGVAWK